MVPESSTHLRALQLQKKIFKSLKAEVALLLGQTPASILNYEKQSQKDFSSALRHSPKTVSKNVLIQSVQEADVTFIADFHTFNQAQRTALRIIRESIETAEGDSVEWIVGTEIIPSHLQEVLDQFQAGKLSVEAFHEAIGYNETWGFPWKNYSPIFEWARKHKVRIVALNRPPEFFLGKEERELHERDVWAAGIITDLFSHQKQESPKPKMIVLYGEHHVGTSHLPRQLTRVSKQALGSPLKSVVIHQNYDRLYWSLAEKQKEFTAHPVKLKENVFCVFSGTPWAKLQSVVSWVEGESHHHPEDDEENEGHSEEDSDYLSIMRAYGDSLAEFFSLAQPSYESLTVCTIAQADFLERLQIQQYFTAWEFRLIKFHVNHNHRLYIPRLKIAYLGSPSLNGAAELTAMHLLSTLKRNQILFTADIDDFYRFALKTAFGFLGSLILNPHRKCDLLDDHLERIEMLYHDEKPAFPMESEARKIAVGVLRNRPFPGLNLKAALAERKFGPPAMVAAKYVGQNLAKKLHQGILKDRVQIQAIRDLFFSPSANASTYESLLESVSHVAVAPSKTESL